MLNFFLLPAALLCASAPPLLAQTAAVEWVAPADKPLPTLTRPAGVQLYRWHNRLVAYGPAATVQKLAARPVAGATVRRFDAPFYRFDRRRCAGAEKANAQWDNVLLTANLVADTAKQHQYLRYHATQYRDWPQVAQGFCQAQFQQLLVFRQGRQLLLVISIPHGASLDKLNPKTTENNPRVNDWNRLMRQYQEGLPGTGPGETWVFLEPVGKK